MISYQYVDGLEIRNNELLNKIEQLQARCDVLELERIEVARKAFLAGANWQAGGLAFNQPVINREANQYIEREYGVHPKQ